MTHEGTAIERDVHARGPARLGGAVLGGALGSATIVAVNQVAERLGLTDLDLLRILGLTFRDPEEDGVKPAGLAWYGLWGGLLVPTLYWLGFRRLGRAGGQVGGALGIVHYVASGALLAATTPRRPKRAVGRGRPMGGFVSRYGPLEWLANLVGHVLYGVVVGRFAARLEKPVRGHLSQQCMRWPRGALSNRKRYSATAGT